MQVDLLEEAHHIRAGVCLSAVIEDLAGGHVQRSEEVDGAVALVVMGHGPGPAGAHGQAGLGAVERLALGLLVETEHHRPLRRVVVESDDIDELVLEVGVVGDLEGVDLPRLEVVVPPDSIRATDSLPIPKRLATVRVVQCVDVSSGVSFSVTRTTSATVPAGSQALRPRPLAITPTPAIPASAKRFRHRRTASGSTPDRRAISSLARPSAAHRSA